jgi:hypothetical protein
VEDISGVDNRLDIVVDADLDRRAEGADRVDLVAGFGMLGSTDVGIPEDEKPCRLFRDPETFDLRRTTGGEFEILPSSPLLDATISDPVPTPRTPLDRYFRPFVVDESQRVASDVDE